MAGPSFEREDILRTWQIYRQPGEVAEVRVLEAGKWLGTVSGYFDNPDDFIKIVSELAADPNHLVPAIYFTINPVIPDLLARAANTVKPKAKSTTSDADIVALHWLPIDLDAKRPAGISSTDDEHAAAISKARETRQWLIDEMGWPANAFVLADSGNGAHLPVKIDLPNNPESVALVKRCLAALDSKFSDGVVHVDATTHNPARIWKISGTMARKGDSIPTRPHRMAKILEAPVELATVSREQLEALANWVSPGNDASGGSPGKVANWIDEVDKASSSDFNPKQYAEAHGAHVLRVDTWIDKEGGKWDLAILEECPFDTSHNRGEARVGVREDGKRTFRCFHNSCQGKNWQALRDLWEPERMKVEIPLIRVNCDQIEAATGVHIHNAEDAPKQNEISEEELNSYSLPDGPKFECNLPNEHFIQRFMAYGSDISDAYIEYWFAGGLFSLAVIAEKKIKVSLKQGTIYPNLYISINGKSSLARKSTVVDKSEALLCQVRPSLLPALVPTEFSPEAFTEHMSDHNHAPWIRDEAAGVLSLMKRDYMRGFKDSLMQLFDCKQFYRKLRTSQRKNIKTEFRVDDPYLNLLWATTDASLGANTEQNDTLSGFMARFLFFFPQGKKTKWLPLEEGTAANSVFEDVMRNQLTSIAEKVASLPGCTALHFSKEGAAYYTEWQRAREDEWTASNDGNAMQIYSRLAPAVVKLAMLFELGSPDFDVFRPIRLEFVEEACRLVDSYFMPTARAVYDLVGANAEKNVIDRIVAYLKKHNGKASRREILKDVKIKSTDFEDYLFTMIESGIVESKTVKRSGKGRDSVYLFLCNVSNVANVANVAIVANVEEIHPDNEGEMGETLATLATKDTLATVDTKEPESPKTIIQEPNDPGLTQFKNGMAKRQCCLCGRSFPYDLTPYFNNGQRGYICSTCHMQGPPPEPTKADSQTRLEAGA